MNQQIDDRLLQVQSKDEEVRSSSPPGEEDGR